MRLGQLARKLSLRPSQLVDFLSISNVQTEEGSNTRLSDEQTRLIVQHFAPDSLEEIMKPATEEAQPESEPEVVLEKPIVVETEEKQPEELAIISQDQPEEEPLPEVIRVQKIELSGLKVLGKIDLPEPKKKEPKVEGETTGEEKSQPQRRGSAKLKHPKRERDQRTWRNPMEAQRQREARELEDKRKAELEREKEKRKHHYQSKVKQVKQPKRSKSLKETGLVQKPVDTRPVPKTWIGKFLRWWTT